MESIKELRAKCQTVHKGDFSAELVRRVSIYITWLLIPTGISANGVSILNIFIAALSGLAFSFGTLIAYSSGILLFVLNTILDGVDGEIARYRKQSSLTGLFLDRINSVFVYPSVFWGIAVGAASNYYLEATWILCLGFLAAWGFLALRLIKTSIDSTLIDALTLEKARIDESTKTISSSSAYLTLSEYLRKQSKWYLNVVDFILIRQPGVCLVFILAVAAETISRLIWNISRAFYSPLLYLLGGYALLASMAVIGGLYIIVSQRRAESSFQQLLGKLQKEKPNKLM
jgi:phosphatidylglycerophosphate synthase